jgi:hypothetical protein
MIQALGIVVMTSLTGATLLFFVTGLVGLIRRLS